MAAATTISRVQLSHLAADAGSLKPVPVDGTAVALHTATIATATDHVYVSGHNVGAAPVKLTVTVAGAITSSFDVTLPAGNARGTRLLVPGLPIFDSASTVTVSMKLAGTPWTGGLSPITTGELAFDGVTGGVASVTTGGIVAPGLDAPPMLLVIEDSLRDADPLNKNLGQVALIELTVGTGGIVSANIIDPGANLDTGNARIRVVSPVLITGYVLREAAAV